MKINASLLILLLTLLVFQGRQLKAQEAGSPSFESYDKDSRNEREKAIGHSEVIEAQKAIAPSISDTAIVRQRNVFKPSPVVPKSKKDGSGADDSILSFNFLYYLIQKYKMQDILE